MVGTALGSEAALQGYLPNISRMSITTPGPYLTLFTEYAKGTLLKLKTLSTGPSKGERTCMRG